MGTTMGQKVRLAKSQKISSRASPPDLAKRIAELRELRERVRLAEQAKQAVAMNAAHDQVRIKKSGTR